MWAPGDNPTEHPDWERQVQLEIDAHDLGVDRFRYKTEKAREGNNMTGLRPYRALLRSWVPGLAEHLNVFIKDGRRLARNTGLIPHGLNVLLELEDSEKAAYIVLRATLDRMAMGSAPLLSLALEIGTNIEHELRMQEWERRMPKLFHGVQRSLTRQGATSVHRRRVNINRFNHLMEEGEIDWPFWGDHQRLKVGEYMLSALLQATGNFFVEDDPTWDPRQSKKPSKPRRVLSMDPRLLERLWKQIGQMEALSPMYLPTLMPPKRWVGNRGGYYTPWVRQPDLIRFKLYQEDQRRAAMQEYEALDFGPHTLDGLHVVQETAWAINQPVYRVAMELWERDLGLAKMPVREVTPLPPMPVSYEARSPELREWRRSPQGLAWRREAAKVAASNALRASAILTTQRTLNIAGRFLDERFYFPHKLDFRGRMYPIPVDLQPQGSDLSRGLLTFAHGKPVSGEDKSLSWLAIHLASVADRDKLSFTDRIDWVLDDEQWARWKRIADDPIANREDWANEDKPFQVLAAALELVAATEALHRGEEFVSSLPVRVDGTCNGIQHLSALLRDEAGGMAVNLIPGDSPRDIYMDVGVAIVERLNEVAQGVGEQADRAEWWLGIFKEGIPRSLVKKPVMTLPYGATATTHMETIEEWLKENHPWTYEEGAMDPSERGKLVWFLVQRLLEAIKVHAKGAMTLMDWITSCAKAATAGNQPLYWRPPIGLWVRQFYGKTVSKQVRLMLDGEVHRVRVLEVIPELDTKKHQQAIAPNYIHSMDAAALIRTLVTARERGVESFTAIHDAYGSVAADMEVVNETLREAFVWLHEHDNLLMFREACQSVLANHRMATEGATEAEAIARAWDTLPPLPERGKLRLSAVIDSDYFFA